MQSISKIKIYGAATVGARGQVVIPIELRKAMKIKAGDQLMVFAKPDRKVISLMNSKGFDRFLSLEKKSPKLKE